MNLFFLSPRHFYPHVEKSHLLSFAKRKPLKENKPMVDWVGQKDPQAETWWIAPGSKEEAWSCHDGAVCPRLRKENPGMIWNGRKRQDGLCPVDRCISEETEAMRSRLVWCLGLDCCWALCLGSWPWYSHSRCWSPWLLIPLKAERIRLHRVCSAPSLAVTLRGTGPTPHWLKHSEERVLHLT